VQELLWAIIACGVVSLIYAVITIQSVMKADQGTARMQEIAAAIREGAQAYLNRQYSTIAIVGVVIAAAALYLGWQVSVGFIIGAVLSGPSTSDRYAQSIPGLGPPCPGVQSLIQTSCQNSQRGCRLSRRPRQVHASRMGSGLQERQSRLDTIR